MTVGHGITETDSGFVAREPAWHGLFPVFPDYLTMEEAIVASGLTWEPVEQDIYLPDEYGYRQVDDYKAIIRSDNEDLLSVQQTSYSVFGNRRIFELANEMANETDVQFETAGSLKGGRKIFVMVRLRTPIEVPGDPRGLALPRMAIQSSHDGSGALRAQALMTRIVCDNTSQMADREAKKNNSEWVFRHTKNMDEYVDQARDAIRGLRGQREEYTEWAERLLGVSVSPEQERAFIELFFPEPPGDVISDRVRNNIHAARGEFRAILNSETTPEAVRPTAYGIVQGAIEYLDHVRGYQSGETQFSRSYLNREPLKQRAEKMILEVAR